MVRQNIEPLFLDISPNIYAPDLLKMRGECD
jgi:hypothetical protein